ncbi:hypothetical protein Plhal304r1_c012g0046971 [Plasmopara halstedii]
MMDQRRWRSTTLGWFQRTNVANRICVSIVANRDKDSVSAESVSKTAKVMACGKKSFERTILLCKRGQLSHRSMFWRQCG